MVLEVKNLSYAYGNKCVLTDVSFSISEGDFLSVLGPNGAGKSTLFKCILGILPDYEGMISIKGKDILTLKRRTLAEHIAYIPQLHHLYSIDVIYEKTSNGHIIVPTGLDKKSHVENTGIRRIS